MTHRSTLLSVRRLERGPKGRGLRSVVGLSTLASFGVASPQLADAASKVPPVKIAIAYTGTGVVRGLDFTATGSGKATPFGPMTLTVANNPAATRPVGVVNGRLLLDQVSAETIRFASGDLYAQGNDRFSFALLVGPDGNPILDPDGRPIPDTSKTVTSVSTVTIVGGTGLFLRATGSMQITGTVTPVAPFPTSLAEPLNVVFSFAGSGTIKRKSNGTSMPVTFPAPPTTVVTPPTTVETATTVATPGSPALPSGRGPVAPGTYSVETANWKFELKLGTGWLVNGSDSGSVGLLRNPGTPDFSGFVILDPPMVFVDPARASAVQPLPADAGAFFASPPNVSVDSTKPITVGGVAGTEYKYRFVPVPSGPQTIGLFSLGSGAAVVLPFGPLPGQIAQSVVLEKDGKRLVIGFGGGTFDPSQPLLDLVVSAKTK
jgi:hypothetical protein